MEWQKPPDKGASLVGGVYFMSEHTAGFFKRKKTLLLVVLLTALYGSVLCIHGSPSFIRPNDDPKELILYTVAFLAGFAYFLSKCISKKAKGSFEINILSGIISTYVLYHIVNLSLAPGHQYEGLIVIGKLVVFILFVGVIASLERQVFFWFFKIFLALGAVAVFRSFFNLSPYQTISFPFGHVSYYSDCAFLLLPGALYFYFSEQRRSIQIIYALITALCTIAIWVSGARATVVGITMSLLIASAFIIIEWKKIFSRRKKIELLVIILISFVGIGLVQEFPKLLRRGATPTTRLLSLAQGLDEQTLEKTSSGRVTIYRNTIEGWRERPFFGWGIGSFKFVYPKFIKANDNQSILLPGGAWLMHSHCELFNQLFEGGLIGGILFSSSLSVLLIYLFRIIRDRGDRERHQALMVFLTIVAVFISFQFSTAFDHPLVRAFLLPYLALAYSLVRDKLQKVKIQTFKKNTANLFLFGILFLSGAVAIGSGISSFYLKRGQIELTSYKKTRLHRIAQFASPWAFNTLYRSADYEMKMRNLQQAEQFLKTGVEQFPYVPLFHYKLGLLYYSQGRYSEAIHLLNPINRLYPHYEPIRNLLKRLDR